MNKQKALMQLLGPQMMIPSSTKVECAATAVPGLSLPPREAHALPSEMPGGACGSRMGGPGRVGSGWGTTGPTHHVRLQALGRAPRVREVGPHSRISLSDREAQTTRVMR